MAGRSTIHLFGSILILLTIHVGQSEGEQSCVEEFIYNAKLYTGCTTDYNDGKFWCSLDHTWEGNWKECTASDPVHFELCVIPFIYDGLQYNGCTKEDNSANGEDNWCALTKFFDVDFWKPCGTSEAGLSKNVSGTRPPCEIPFTFDGISRDGCIPIDNDGVNWCSLSSDYDEDQQRQDCEDEVLDPGFPCAGTFAYQGLLYEGCITKGSDGKYWCSLDLNYDSSRWKYCDLATDELDPHYTTCVESFEFGGETITGCTSSTDDLLWCSFDEDYDGKWRECDDTIATELGIDEGSACVATFTYEGVEFDGCTDFAEDFHWCSFVETYTGDTNQRRRCLPGEISDSSSSVDDEVVDLEA